jgi:hypothetical protein
VSPLDTVSPLLTARQHIRALLDTASPPLAARQHTRAHSIPRALPLAARQHTRAHPIPRALPLTARQHIRALVNSASSRSPEPAAHRDATYMRPSQHREPAARIGGPCDNPSCVASMGTSSRRRSPTAALAARRKHAVAAAAGTFSRRRSPSSALAARRKHAVAAASGTFAPWVVTTTSSSTPVSDVENARGVLVTALPAAIVAHIDVSSLSLRPGIFVDENLEDRYSELSTPRASRAGRRCSCCQVPRRPGHPLDGGGLAPTRTGHARRSAAAGVSSAPCGAPPSSATPRPTSSSSASSGARTT